MNWIRNSAASLTLARDLHETLTAHGSCLAVVKNGKVFRLSEAHLQEFISQARRRNRDYTLDQWMEKILFEWEGHSNE
jgi:hypothetical protein